MNRRRGAKSGSLASAFGDKPGLFDPCIAGSQGLAARGGPLGCEAKGGPAWSRP
ncbi:MAG: hypothetical protein FWH50_02785 [Coriobacteriia bacterium]|nr:hypothetical protein [Coriobacteriia bacterium]